MSLSIPQLGPDVYIRRDKGLVYRSKVKAGASASGDAEDASFRVLSLSNPYAPETHVSTDPRIHANDLQKLVFSWGSSVPDYKFCERLIIIFLPLADIFEVSCIYCCRRCLLTVSCCSRYRACGWYVCWVLGGSPADICRGLHVGLPCDHCSDAASP